MYIYFLQLLKVKFSAPLSNFRIIFLFLDILKKYVNILHHVLHKNI